MAYKGRDESLEFFEDCFAKGIRLLMDDKNNELYVYLKTFMYKISEAAYNFKFRINFHCLWLGSSIHVKLRGPSELYEVCFSEIGRYMYDTMHPVIPQGLCGDGQRGELVCNGQHLILDVASTTSC